MNYQVNDFWTVVPEKTHEHWLEVKDPNGRFKGHIKWDGCFEIHYDIDEPKENTFYVHYCDIDREIARLCALKELARRHFKDDIEFKPFPEIKASPLTV
jgi:hypothetical protein